MSQINIKSKPIGFAVSLQGNFLAVGYQDGILEIVNLKNKENACKIFLEQTLPNAQVEQVCFSEDESLLAFSYYQKVMLIELKTCQIVQTFDLMKEEGQSSTLLRFFGHTLYFPNGTSIFCYNHDSAQLRKISLPFLNGFGRIAISACGNYLAYKSNNHNSLSFNFLSKFYIINTQNFSLEKEFELAYDYFEGGQMFRAAFEFSKKNPFHLHLVHKTQGILSWDWQKDQLIEHTAWEELQKEGIFAAQIESCQFQASSQLVAFRSYQNPFLRQEEHRQATFFDFGKHQFIGNLPSDHFFGLDKENFVFLKENDDNEAFTVLKIPLKQYLDM